MVCAGLCFLLCLLSSDIIPAESNEVNSSTLGKIVKYIQDKFGPDGNQPYAVAISVHKDHCTSKFDSIKDKFLSNDTQQEVQEGLKKGFYKGQELMAAKTVQTKVRKLSIRAEYTLLYPPKPSQSPLQVLLNRTGLESCVVLYVLVSPCVKPCSNINGPYSLHLALEQLHKHRGPKAFVFSQLWKDDKDVSGSLKEIDQHVPVYRCTPQCLSCRANQGVINKGCIN